MTWSWANKENIFLFFQVVIFVQEQTISDSLLFYHFLTARLLHARDAIPVVFKRRLSVRNIQITSIIFLCMNVWWFFLIYKCFHLTYVWGYVYVIYSLIKIPWQIFILTRWLIFLLNLWTTLEMYVLICI